MSLRATVRQEGGFLPQRLQVLAAVLAVLGLTLLACTAVYRDQQTQREAAFARDAKRVLGQMQARLQTHFDALLGVRGLYAAQGSVSRLQFRQFLAELRLADTHPGFQAIQFVRVVPDDAAAAFEQTVREDRSVPGERFADFSIRPPGSRPMHYVIEFTEPMAGNEKAFGFDLAALPAHLQALELGRDTGRLVATERVKLLQDTRAQAGFVVRLPIYRRGAAVDTLAQRRAALLGFAALVYRVDDLMREAIDPQLLPFLRLRIQDLGYAAQPSGLQGSLLFDSEPEAPVSTSESLRMLDSLVVGERRWQFEFTGRPEGRYAPDLELLAVMAGSGLVMALLVASVVAAWSSRRALATRLARTVAEQQAIFDNAAVGIDFVRNRTILACNLRMADMLGYRTDELIGASTRLLYASDEAYAALGDAAYGHLGQARDWIGEVEWVRKDGSPIHCRLHGRHIMPDQPELGSIWVMYDISAQKQADAALHEANRQLQLSLAAQEAHSQALSASHAQVTAAYQEAQALREQAEVAQHQALQALDELRAAQAQLVHAEKMATLGQLVASVAHEINTPIAAIKSSGGSMDEALQQLLDSAAEFGQLDLATRQLFARLVLGARRPAELLSSRETRHLVRSVAQALQAAGVDQPLHQAGLLVQLQAQAQWADYLPLLQHRQAALVLRRAENMATLITGTANINTAVDRVSKIVFALKSYSRSDPGGAQAPVDLAESLDTVLLLYHNQIKRGVELVRRYADTPPLHGWPDELNQVWTNLLHNALQAMDYKGTLTVDIQPQGAEVCVSVGDSGCGIPAEVLPRIFDPFFTTKPKGEGSGLGLDIVKKIVVKHQGRIEVDSTPGQGTVFRVYLPLRPAHQAPSDANAPARVVPGAV